MESKKIEFFNRLSFFTLLITIFVSFFFFIPFSQISLDESKGFIVSIGATLSLFFWFISRLGEGKFTLPRERLIIFAGLIPLIFLLSSFFSLAPRVSLWGNSFELGTFASTIVMFILLFLSSNFFQTEKKLWYFVGTIFIGGLVISIFEIFNVISIFLKLPLSGFIQKSFAGNLIGSWNNFAIFFGLVVLVSLFTLEFLKSNKIFLIIQYFLLIIGLFFLIIINVPFVWILIGIFSIIIFIYILSNQDKGISIINKEENKKIFPFKSFIVIIVAFIVLVSNNSISIFISKYINLSNIEVRPAISTTFKIGWESLKSNYFLGTGPNTFSLDWALWQPKEIAQTIFWNVDFSSGFSTFITFIINTGIICLVAWILFFLVYIMRVIQSLRVASGNSLSSYFILVTLIISLYSWFIFILYISNIIMLMLAFVSTGVLVGILISRRVVNVKEFSFLNDPRRSFFTIFSLMFLIIGTLYATYLNIERFVSLNYFYKGLSYSNTTIDSLYNSERMLKSAISLDNNDIYNRVLSQIYIAQINNIINDSSNKLSPEVLKSNLQQLINLSITSASLAINQNPKQYLNHLNIANIYAYFVPLSVEDSYNNSIIFYQKARELSPNNPSILLAMAQLEVLNKNNVEARKYIQQALDIKLNYTDALILLSQIETDEGNILNAIKQIKIASELNPNDADVFFRLGLLRYNNLDYVDAIGSFEQAVLINNSYLNARYFLGKSYQKVGRKDDAMIQYKIISNIIPDNQDIKDAIDSISKIDDSNKDPVITDKKLEINKN